MESQLFYWTGLIIWYAVCTCACAIVGGVVVVAPIVATRKCINHLWKWKLSAELMKYGFTQEEVRYAHSIRIGGLPCDYDEFISAVQRIKSRSKNIPQ